MGKVVKLSSQLCLWDYILQPRAVAMDPAVWSIFGSICFTGNEVT